MFAHVYKYVHTFIHALTCAYTPAEMQTCTHPCRNMQTYGHAYTFAHMHMYPCTNAYTCTNVHTHAHTHTLACKHIHIHSCRHTQAQTQVHMHAHITQVYAHKHAQTHTCAHTHACTPTCRCAHLLLPHLWRTAVHPWPEQKPTGFCIPGASCTSLTLFFHVQPLACCHQAANLGMHQRKRRVGWGWPVLLPRNVIEILSDNTVKKNPTPPVWMMRWKCFWTHYIIAFHH